jgi:RimJ/RimL family protein N-acetyltransferase
MLIRTGRLLLRAAEDSDASFVAHVMNADEAVLAYGPHFPRSAAFALQKIRDPRSTCLIAEEASTRTPVGFIRSVLSWGDTAMSIEDFVLDPAFMRRGYGREALGALLKFFFDTWVGRRAELQVRADNAPAIRCYLALGFKEEGRRRSVVPAGWGTAESQDYLVMGLLPGELISPGSGE